MDRSTLYSVTKISTSSRSLAWALCDTGAKLGPWPANSSSPRTGTGRPPRASSRQTDTEPPESKGAAEQGKDDTSRSAVWQVKVSHFKPSWAPTAPQLRCHRRCYRLAGKKAVWTSSFPISRGKPQWSEHSSVLSLAGVTETTQLCFSLLANRGVVTLWTGKEIPEVKEYPIKQH